MSQSRKGPFRLVTVNTVPERAKRLIGCMIEALSDRYEIVHVANCSTIKEIALTVRQQQPDVLFSASMRTPEEVAEIQGIAVRERPGIKTHALPQGLQVQMGPDAVVDYLVEAVPGLLNNIEA